jgi:hypothetical protein
LYTVHARYHGIVLAHETAMLALLVSRDHLRLVVLKVLLLILLRVHQIVLLPLENHLTGLNDV